jgi:peptidoglycan/xylan/chitin deacetylase (PgdA/CDA1 family)
MNVVTLAYHDIIPEGRSMDSSGFSGAWADSYKITQAELCRHLDAIHQTKIQPGIMETLTHDQPGRAAVLITFDDGGCGAWECAANLLEHKGWRGHFFIVTDCIGKPGFLNSGQINDLYKRGHGIGSHGKRHTQKFSRITRVEMEQEWRKSTEVLAEITGNTIITGSVPGGYYTRKAAETAAACGIRYLFTSEPRIAIWQDGGCTVLGRYSIKQSTSANAVQRLVTGAGWERQKQWLRRKLLQPAKWCNLEKFYT